MRINYHLDLSETRGGIVRVTVSFTGVTRGTGIRLPAIGKKPGIEITGLLAKIRGIGAVPFRVSGELITRPAADFSLEYALHIGLEHTVGTDNDSELLYPFLNRQEIFLASGTLPYPEHLPLLAPGIKASLRVTGIPRGLKVFSSIEGTKLCPGQLDSFFIYLSDKRPATHIYSGKTGKTRFSLLVQKGKKIPLTRAAVWRHTNKVMRSLEGTFSAYAGFDKIKILILQAPDDFEKLAGERTFATGENVPGGILTYAPTSKEYLRRKFGHSSYRFLLQDGLAHELTHFYSTAAWQGKYKSLLFPAEKCPPRHKRLIGEILTCYFHRGIVRSKNGGTTFIAREILPRISAWRIKPSKQAFLDLFLLDLWMRRGGSSLKGAVRCLIQKFGANHKPYPSARVLIKAAEASNRAQLPSWLKKTLLTDYSPDYTERLDELSFHRKMRFNPISE